MKYAKMGMKIGIVILMVLALVTLTNSAGKLYQLQPNVGRAQGTYVASQVDTVVHMYEYGVTPFTVNYKWLDSVRVTGLRVEKWSMDMMMTPAAGDTLIGTGGTIDTVYGKYVNTGSGLSFTYTPARYVDEYRFIITYGSWGNGVTTNTYQSKSRR